MFLTTFVILYLVLIKTMTGFGTLNTPSQHHGRFQPLLIALSCCKAPMKCWLLTTLLQFLLAAPSQIFGFVPFRKNSMAIRPNSLTTEKESRGTVCRSQRLANGYVTETNCLMGLHLQGNYIEFCFMLCFVDFLGASNCPQGTSLKQGARLPGPLV